MTAWSLQELPYQLEECYNKIEKKKRVGLLCRLALRSLVVELVMVKKYEGESGHGGGSRL